MFKFSFFIKKKGPGILIYLKQIVRLQPFLEKKEIVEKKIIGKIRRRNYSPHSSAEKITKNFSTKNTIKGTHNRHTMPMHK